MSKMLLMAAMILMWLLTPAKVTWACEANVPCESVVAIDVGKGRRHLPGGKTETLYVASVVVDATKSDLKEVLADCPRDTILIHIEAIALELPKVAISTGGDWFAIERATPTEALDAAMSLCPEKVTSHIP